MPVFWRRIVRRPDFKPGVDLCRANKLDGSLILGARENQLVQDINDFFMRKFDSSRAVKFTRNAVQQIVKRLIYFLYVFLQSRTHIFDGFRMLIVAVKKM